MNHHRTDSKSAELAKSADPILAAALPGWEYGGPGIVQCEGKGGITSADLWPHKHDPSVWYAQIDHITTGSLPSETGVIGWAEDVDPATALSEALDVARVAVADLAKALGVSV